MTVGHDEITDDELAALPVQDLVTLRQGCTELTCIYHGKYNMELRRRRV